MSETKRRIFIIIVLLLVILFGVGQFFAFSNPNASQPAQNSNPPTQVITYVPPAPASSTPIERGSCFAGSIAAPYRSDAWRCAIGNSISDPCFAIPGSTSTLACGENPAGTDTSSTFVLQLTKPLPAENLVPSSTPPTWAWLIELGDGTVCSPFTGTRPFDASGDVAMYGCNSALPGENLIFGDLNNSSSSGVWTAEVGEFSTPTSTLPVLISSTTVPVFAVWQ